MERMEAFGRVFFSKFLSVLQVDRKTWKVTLLKSQLLPDLKGKTFTPEQLTDMVLDSGKVYSGDADKIRSSLCAERIEYGIAHQEEVQTEYVRILNEDHYEWVRYTILVDETDRTQDVFVVCVPLTEKESIDIYLLEDMKKNSYRAGIVSLDREKSFSLYDSQNFQFSRNHQFSNFDEYIAYITAHLIHKDDRKMVTSELSIANLIRYFDRGEENFQIYYRRKFHNTYRWVECRLHRTVEYEPGKRNLILIVFDLNEAIVQLYNKQSINDFEQLTGGRSEQAYYSMLTGAMYLLTEPYHNFFVIDVEHNAYISCKRAGSDTQNQLPPSGIYDRQIAALANRLFDDEEKKRLLQFSSLANLKKVLENNTSVRSIFRYANGERMVLTYTKYARLLYGAPLIVGCTRRLESSRKQLKVQTFGTFEIYDQEGNTISFRRKKAMEVLAYLIDRDGFEVTTTDIVHDVLHEREVDLNARKYASFLINHAIKSLEQYGYGDVIIKDKRSIRINKDAVDCDYYRLLNGELHDMEDYGGEYMKQYSWAEETNASIPHYF